jgi:hypothetical protein
MRQGTLTTGCGTVCLMRSSIGRSVVAMRAHFIVPVASMLLPSFVAA